ncbi:albumin [Trifolium pratense]|uniref:Albumin n=1 Tax=Trifolium pratense TaxID=57577 RepID=A0A2K3LSY6_TRIPR|nr:albumin [Trifolium pratense]
MAYVKLAPLAVFFLLATFLIFPMNKVDAQTDLLNDYTNILGSCGGGDGGCICLPEGLGKMCFPRAYKDVVKAYGENFNVCQSHVDCEKKRSGSFCIRYPVVDYGLCVNVASESVAKDLSLTFKFAPEFINHFLKMPVTTAKI